MIAQSLQLTLLTLSTLAAAAPAAVSRGHAKTLVDRQIQVLNPYAPVQNTCPSTSLVRPASGINGNEASYVSARKTKANVALTAWLKRQGAFSTSSLPTVALVSSGGGLRALLTTAGVVQGLDIRDSSLNTSGIYQSLTYESGLSGGAWFLSSLAGNNWPTVSYLKTTLWEQAFQNSALVPANLLSPADATEYAAVTADIAAKTANGYAPTLVDAYGRLLSYQLLQGADGGAGTRLSTLTTLGNFTAHNVPYPIITVNGVNGSQGQCFPTVTSAQYEFHPYEYGSWDAGISAFANTQYMGTNLTNGQPTTPNVCTLQYDNLGYIFGTSSDVLNAGCAVVNPSSSPADLTTTLEGILFNAGHTPTFQDLYGIYPNPFYHYSRSPTVQNDKLLTLVDGGEGGQNDPIWPFIQPSRKVDVLIVSDNSADTSGNFPNGTEIQQTYINAQAAGLTKMPFIPDVNTFVSQGLNQRATFFGCNETGTTFIVFLPNVAYTYPSGQSTFKVEYMVAETDGMIANGVQIAAQNGTQGWPFCLGCAIKNKDGAKLPAGCNACFKKYCYYRSGTSG